MKMKFLLGAIVALSFSQSTQPLGIAFVNNKYPSNVGVAVYESKNDSSVLEVQKKLITGKGVNYAQAFYVGMTGHLNGLGITYFHINQKSERSLPLHDLKSYNIPTTGDHMITVSIEDFGSLGIVVDRGDKILVPLRSQEIMAEDV